MLRFNHGGPRGFRDTKSVGWPALTDPATMDDACGLWHASDELLPMTIGGLVSLSPISYRPILSCLFVVALLSGMGPAAVGAEEDERSHDPASFRGWKISGFEIRGIDGGLKGDLKNGLVLSGQRSKIFWRKYSDFDEQDMVEDLARTRIYLARHGYPSARIQPAFKPDSEDREVEVIFEIDPGPEVLVAENRTVAFPPALEPQAEEILELEEGERFADERVEKRVGELLDVLKHSGYAYATVTSRLTRPDSNHVVVDFVVDAGEVYTFGPTVVRGVDEGFTEVVQRTVAIEPGARYTPEKIQSASDNLRLLDLFRKIRVYTEPGSGTTLVVVADLAERKMQTFNANAGYWTEDRVRLITRYRHRNIFGQGRGLGAETSYSRYLQEASLTYWRPTLFHSRTRGSLSLTGRRESEPGYLLQTGEIELAGTYLPSTVTSFRPSITLSLIDIRSRVDPADFEDPGPSLIFGTLSWVREDLDDRLSPKSGERRGIRIEAGLPGLQRGRQYLLFEPEQVVYVPLIEEKLTWVARAGVGLAAPRRPATYLLPNKRFYGGGAGSMRGVERKKLGPLDDEKRPVGGVAKAEASMELRFPLIWRFEGAAFVDAGQVWSSYGDVALTDLRFAVGPGVGMATPIGPVRADVGFLIGARQEHESLARFVLSIGNVF